MVSSMVRCQRTMARDNDRVFMPEERGPLDDGVGEEFGAEPVTNLEGVPLSVRSSGHSQRRFYSSIVSGFSSVIGVSLLGAVAVRVITVQMGAAAYGTFILVVTFMTLVQNSSSLGLAQVLTREVAKGEGDESRLLSLAMGLRVLMGIVAIPLAFGLGLLLYGHHSGETRLSLLVILLAVPLTAIWQVGMSHFAAQLRNVVISTISFVQQVIYVVLVLVAVALHESVVFPVAAVVIGWAFAAIVVVILARREVKFSVAYDRTAWITMLRISTPVGLAYLLGTLYLKADTLVLGVMSTAKQVGYYGVAYAVMSFFLVLPVVLGSTFLPGITRASHDELEARVHLALKYFAMFGVLAATAILVSGPTIVQIFAGPHFGPAVAPLRILGLGLIFIFSTSGLSSICVARGSANRLFVMTLSALILNIALNIAVIPSFGIRGSAVVTLVCEVVSSILIARLIRKDLAIKARNWGVLVRPLIAGVVTCVVLFPLYARPHVGNGIGLALIPAVLVIFVVVLALVRGYPEDLVHSIRTTLIGRRGRHAPGASQDCKR